jgi:metal-responsive CopG/Arc/MetJ family transcriptional regulator
MRKIAITLPEDQAEAIEKIRRRQRIPRSRIIQQAVARYLAERREFEAVKAYEEGYRRKPERVAEAEALAKATAATMEAEDWS